MADPKFLPPGTREPGDPYLAIPFRNDLHAAITARDEAWRQELARAVEEAVAAYRERMVAWLLFEEHEGFAADVAEGFPFPLTVAGRGTKGFDAIEDSIVRLLDRARSLIGKAAASADACPGRTTQEPR